MKILQKRITEVDGTRQTRANFEQVRRNRSSQEVKVRKKDPLGGHVVAYGRAALTPP